MLISRHYYRPLLMNKGSIVIHIIIIKKFIIFESLPFLLINYVLCNELFALVTWQTKIKGFGFFK